MKEDIQITYEEHNSNWLKKQTAFNIASAYVAHFSTEYMLHDVVLNRLGGVALYGYWQDSIDGGGENELTTNQIHHICSYVHFMMRQGLLVPTPEELKLIADAKPLKEEIIWK